MIRDMTHDMTLTPVPASAYAASVGVTVRTVKRWLERDQLPGAFKDARGRWLIPSDAPRPVIDDPLPTRPTSDVAAREVPAARPDLDMLPSFLALDMAAKLLGISEHAVRSNREYFDVHPFGRNGALVVPLATIKRIRGWNL